MSDREGTAGGPADSGDGIRIFSATWVLPIVSDPIHKGAVAVAGDKIIQVGTQNALTEAYPGAEVTDFHHAIISPGFVNCHSHLEYAVFRGLLDNKNFGPWMLEFIDQKAKLSSADYEVSSFWAPQSVSLPASLPLVSPCTRAPVWRP